MVTLNPAKTHSIHNFRNLRLNPKQEIILLKHLKYPNSEKKPLKYK